MHELRLDKHLKTKEVEMLALATINIISVDEKVENSQKSCSSTAQGGLVAFPVQESGAVAGQEQAGLSARMQEVRLQFR